MAMPVPDLALLGIFVTSASVYCCRCVALYLRVRVPRVHAVHCLVSEVRCRVRKIARIRNSFGPCHTVEHDTSSGLVCWDGGGGGILVEND